MMHFLYLFMCLFSCRFVFFFFKQKTAYEMRISDWSSDVCSSDLCAAAGFGRTQGAWLIVAHPGNADQFGSESCEPSVVRIVCSAGFAADVVALEFALHARACPVGGYPAQHVVHDINRARIDGSCYSVARDYRLGPPEYLSPPIG